MAQSTRPQFASAPNIAAFSRLEQTTLFATVRAVERSSAPSTRHSSSLVAPSPSPAIMRQSCTVTVFSAVIKAEKSVPGAMISGFPAKPLASSVTMSLVEVSPSTLTILKVPATSLESTLSSIVEDMAASVVRNTSIVAILGWIMPLPLAMPPKRQVLPPSSNSTATDFGTVSVVMMASTAARFCAAP